MSCFILVGGEYVACKMPKQFVTIAKCHNKPLLLELCAPLSMGTVCGVCNILALFFVKVKLIV